MTQSLPPNRHQRRAALKEKKSSKILLDPSMLNTSPYQNGLQPLNQPSQSFQADLAASMNGSPASMPDLKDLTPEDLQQIMGQPQITPGSEKSVQEPTSEDEGLKPGNIKTRDGYTKIYSGLGLMLFAANKVDGTLIMQEAELRATELILLAQMHPKLLKFLKKALQYNVYAGFALGHLGVAFAIMINHDRFPPAHPLIRVYGKAVDQARVNVAIIEAAAAAQQLRETQGDYQN